MFVQKVQQNNGGYNAHFWGDHTFRSTEQSNRFNNYTRSGDVGSLRPALVASRLRLSSLSPCDRTCPHSAKVVDVFMARPLESTSAMLI